VLTLVVLVGTTVVVVASVVVPLVVVEVSGVPPSMMQAHQLLGNGGVYIIGAGSIMTASTAA